ncbi:MAG TPA: hypothetical protein VJA40_00085 [archaeon]|nr:hypothetical protein [archaeon]
MPFRGQVSIEGIIAIILISFALLFTVLMTGQQETATRHLERVLDLENKCNNFSELVSTVFQNKDKTSITLEENRDYDLVVDANNRVVSIYSTAQDDLNNYCLLLTPAVVDGLGNDYFTIRGDRNAVKLENFNKRVVITD